MTSGRPNVLLILADDMGFSDIGCYGSEIATPNLDALAAGGLRFSSFYNTARCCPSRAALLTGLYPHQAGVGLMVGRMNHPSYQGYLKEECVTLGDVLGGAGYYTGLSGKWHVGGHWPRRPGDPAREWSFGDPVRPLPTERGFQRFYGNPAGGGNYFNVRPLIDQDRIVEPQSGFYGTDAYTDAAIRMIDEAREAAKPFFVHLCYNAPHWPLHAWPEDVARYRGRYARGWDHVRTARHEQMKKLGIVDPKWPISPRDPDAPPWEDSGRREWEDARMAVYAAQVDCMDRNVGRIVRHLGETGRLDDTMIVFLSDNGGCAEYLSEKTQWLREVETTLQGEPVRIGNRPDLEPGPGSTFMSYDLPWANASNSPFRMFKHWVHEGGIATPAIVHWPKGLKDGGRIAREVCHEIDLAATIIDAAGASRPAEHKGKPVPPLEGESFLELLKGNPWSRRAALFWEHEGNRAVRDGPWKLVSRHPGGWELYHMERDRTELNDLAPGERDRVRAMAGLYGDWAARCGVVPWDELRNDPRYRA